MEQIPNFKNFSEALQYIVDKYGVDIFADKNRLKNILNDLLPNKFIREKKGVDDAYFCKVVDLMMKADKGSEDEKTSSLKAARKKLLDIAGLSDTMANNTLLYFAEAFGWDMPCCRLAIGVDKPRTVLNFKRRNIKMQSKKQDNQDNQDDDKLHIKTKRIEVVGTKNKSKTKAIIYSFAVISFAALITAGIYNYFFASELPAANINNINNIILDTTTMASDIIDSKADTLEESSESIQNFYITEIDTISSVDSDTYIDIYNFNGLTLYEPEENILYYFADNRNMLYAYDINKKETFEKISFEDLKRAIMENVEEIIELEETDSEGEDEEETKIETEDSESDDDADIIPEMNEIDDIPFSVSGIRYNSYSKEVYIYGIHGVEEYRWLYNLSQGTVHKLNEPWGKFFFVNEHDYLYCQGNESSHKVVNFVTEDSVPVRNNKGYDYLFYHNNSYYGLIEDSHSYIELYKLGNIFLPQPELIKRFRDANPYSVNYYDGYLYICGNDNNVHKFNLDNLKEEPYITVANITQTGMSFLSDDCTGLIITNDGGYITYDFLNKKFKHIIPGNNEK